MTAPVLQESEFLQSVARHMMAVVLDTPLHRHLHFTAPDTGVAAFDIVTWPGHLCITGDMGTFTFARVKDMFTLFRQDPEQALVDGQTLIIHPAPWSDKLTSIDMDTGFEEFSPDKFREEVGHWLDDCGATDADRAAAETEILQKLSESDEAAFLAACNFEHGDVRFYDFATTANCTDYTYRYLWNCYAIVWAIGYYDDMVAANAEAAKSALPAPEVQP